MNTPTGREPNDHGPDQTRSPGPAGSAAATGSGPAAGSARSGGSPRPLRLGTRRSKLAMAQSGTVAARVTEVTGRPVELVEITTYGDVSKESLAQIGGTGVFVSALRDALLSGAIDFAVHSLKDLPTADPEGLVLAAIPDREDPRDALVARDGLGFAALPPGATVGTGSPRRMAQLNAWARSHGLHIETVPIRGNVDTRIGYVTSGKLDAVVLAAAGLNRIGRLAEASELIDTDVVLPAPGQGALAVECAASNPELAAQLGELDDPFTRAAVTAERSLLAALEAGCSAPVGALADLVADGQNSELRLRGVVGTTDGTALVQMSITGPVPASDDEARSLGRELAVRMLAKGAAGLMGERTP
ncbi:hydroxymethylbilane synthase [Streptomyces sp. DvalAA-14]|uniref:hydroxymethylbilane synthase n=1 Tax=unclassified Streptomyces TaxID=2593676 RepID=UPI00081BB9E9|nr:MULTISPECIES: hydroxymethylbilane synthase [unclassified Streptomyces]MYS21609.1 hydroxymethylbilane synthase [Streptomyces sp. SID4948]SCD96626.1 hydroxymethylbilane synthase [Streptomyces sp. DvalAA-14]